MCKTSSRRFPPLLIIFHKLIKPSIRLIPSAEEIMSNSKLLSSSSTSSSGVVQLGTDNWPTFKPQFVLIVQTECGEVAHFMIDGTLPLFHPFNPKCVYASTAADAIQVGDITDTWKDLNGNDTGPRVKVAGKLQVFMAKAVRVMVLLIPGWLEWSLGGRVDIMLKPS